jgi:CheY-like chemotaxis protein/two-component sensor histidine kinase
VLARQVHQLARLVDDLLDVTRISSGKIQLRRERIDIAALAGTVADDLRPVFAARGVRLEVALRQSGPLFVNGDRTRLAQVISNLLANAAKFSPAASAVTISVECSEGEAVLQVVDAGLGIHPDLLPHVFEPFVQADRTLERSDGGLGLGLALVRSIVDLHGGSVAAASDGPGTGASFVVRLELAAEQSERAVLGRTGAPSGAGRSVLVVEDNRDAASSLKELLELAGHRVEVAHDGGAAVLAAQTSHPDVVLCDVGLPVKDGYQVAREIRSDPGLCGTFLVALTGYAFEEDLERARQSGFDDHLRKPPDIEALQRIIRRSPEAIRR